MSEGKCQERILHVIFIIISGCWFYLHNSNNTNKNIYISWKLQVIRRSYVDQSLTRCCHEDWDLPYLGAQPSTHLILHCLFSLLLFCFHPFSILMNYPLPKVWERRDEKWTLCQCHIGSHFELWNLKVGEGFQCYFATQ